MADEGTLATTAQVLLAIGANPSTAQSLEANTNYWVKYAEAELSAILEVDLVDNYSNIETNFKQLLASAVSARAAMHAINQDMDNWDLSVSQSKLNVLNTIWQDSIQTLVRQDVLSLIGAN